jgi:outer membrane protein assembly factor BamB
MRRWGLLLVVGGALAAASLAGSASSAVTGRGWTRTDVGAVSQPAPVGGKFAFYAQHRGALEVVALDAGTGSTAWAAPASPSAVTAGVPAELAVRGTTVFYLEGVGAPGNGAARVVAKDAASGNVLWRSNGGRFFSWPEICPDQPSAVCVSGTVVGAGWGQIRFATADGKVLADVKMGTANDPGRELGPDLFDPGSRSPEQLLVVANGREAWSRPLSRIFPLPRASSDGGWDFDRFANLGMYVGSVATRPAIKNGEASLDLGGLITAGFTANGGRVLWRARGLYSCGQPLLCPGRSQAGYTSPSTGTAASVGLRMVDTGTVTYPLSGGKPKVSANASVTIQGFDPKTGRTKWSFRAGRNIPLMSNEAVPPQITSTVMVLKAGSRLVALDLRSGRTRRLAPAAHAWCQHIITYRLAHTSYYGGRGGMYTGQEGLFPCTVSGKRIAPPRKIPGFVRRLGATTGGMTAWTDTHAVHAGPS